MPDAIDPTLDPTARRILAHQQAREQARERKPSFKSLPPNLKYAWRLLLRASPSLVTTVLTFRLVTALIGGVLILMAPAAVEGLREEGLTAAGFLRFVPFIAALAFTSLIGTGSSSLQEYLNAKVQKVITDEILDVAASVELASYESPQFFDHLQRVETNSLIAPTQLSQAVVLAVPQAIGILAAMGALLKVEPLILPVLIASVIPFALIARAATRREFEFAKSRTLSDRQRAYLRYVLTGKDEAKEVRAFGSGPLLRARYEERYEEYLALLRKQSRRRVVIGWLMWLATIAAVGSWVGTIVFLFLSGKAGVRELGAAAVAAPMLVTRFAALGMSLSQTLQASIFVDDFKDFMKLKIEKLSAVGGKSNHLQGRLSQIEVDSVRLSYPGTETEALRGVSMRLKAGQVVALVGENGSGKTTLAKIIGQLYRPTSGRVLVNGVDTTNLDETELRKQIAVIFQDFVRYQLTAADNVGLGNPETIDDQKRIRAAAAQAGARDFLEKLPEAYETILSKAFPGGQDLSIGQWQRVALARAFFRDAPFIILDEPTAALDARAEYDLFERLRELRRGRTLLLISHRFSTVRSADHIYVMNQGEIIEDGSHEALMKNEGLYSELFNLQTSVDLQPAAD